MQLIIIRFNRLQSEQLNVGPGWNPYKIQGDFRRKQGFVLGAEGQTTPKILSKILRFKKKIFFCEFCDFCDFCDFLDFLGIYFCVIDGKNIF